MAKKQRRRQNGPIWQNSAKHSIMSATLSVVAIMALLSLYALAGFPYLVLIPAYAKDVLTGPREVRYGHSPDPALERGLIHLRKDLSWPLVVVL